MRKIALTMTLIGTGAVLGISALRLYFGSNKSQQNKSNRQSQETDNTPLTTNNEGRVFALGHDHYRFGAKTLAASSPSSVSNSSSGSCPSL